MPVRELSVEELRETLDQHKAISIVDVRPAPERAEWSIPGSRHVDAYDELWRGETGTLRNAVSDLPRDRPIVAVCAKGKTSMLAADVLDSMGFSAYSLAGGMAAWTLAWNVAPVVLKAPSAAAIVQVRRTGKGCLSYLVGSEGEAAVVDPSVDPAVYVRLAEQRGWTIVAVLDTHVHADHVSRAYDLARITGAHVHLPAQRRVHLPFTPVLDGSTLQVGRATITAMATPGHTHESMCYRLDEAALFTGDTLFLKGVGRPDLKAEGHESRDRARLLYHSLRERVLTLDGDVIVLPGHTSAPISFDGIAHAAALADVRASIDLANLGEDAFVETVLGRIPPNPPNHLRIVHINEGHEAVPDDILSLEAGANRCAVSS
jgi:glyoxylase-like metal-dependent hydrolase (beta-lactamase superfamily II)/rhodanese-related sulfurtransferase